MFKSLMLAAVIGIATISNGIAVDLSNLKIVYLDPESAPESLFRVEGWPSFLFTAHAPVVVNYQPRPRVAGSSSGSSGDLDCSDFSGPVAVTAGDPNGLDADHDGIGCE